MIQTTDVPVVPLPDVPTDGVSAFKALEGLSLDEALTKIANGLVSFGFKLLIALLVFYVGKFVIKKIYKMTYSLMVNRKVDPSLTTFVLSLIRIVLYFILIVTVIGILGLETSSFLALFASAGVAIGMALSGTLQNFAGGVLILLLKPYKVGDYIEAQGFAGTVKAIQIFHTVINTVDNKAIIIPNGGLSTGSINNYSLEQYRRVDWTIGLSYGCDFQAAREKILSMLSEDDRIVIRYVEDDIARRAEVASNPEIDCLEHPDDPACRDNNSHSYNMSWWRRFRIRRRRHQEAIQQALREKVNMNAGIPVKVERAPFVGLNELADSSVNVVVRVWTHASNYWALYFDMNERFYRELPEAGFDFPFPQLDVHCVGDTLATDADR